MHCAFLLFMLCAAGVVATTTPAQPLASVNIVHALWAAWNTTTVPLAGIATAAHAACADRGFTTVRVAGSPYWPTQGYPLYLANETAYWSTRTCRERLLHDLQHFLEHFCAS